LSEVTVSSEPVIKKRTLHEVIEEIKTVYLDDNRPWIIGFSGGKDSTCMVQLVWTALSQLPPDKLQKKIYVISSNTLVEAPQIAERITGNLEKMEKYAKDQSSTENKFAKTEYRGHLLGSTFRQRISCTHKLV
jgi:DNA sulfur modification protein DndC